MRKMDGRNKPQETEKVNAAGYKTGQQVSLVGIGMGTVDTLTAEAFQAIRESDCLIGAKRMLEAVCQAVDIRGITGGKAVYNEYQPKRIQEIIAAHPEYHKIAVLYSGDIGFYSGARELYGLIGEHCEVRGIPGISSVMYLAARLNVSWEDARLVSIHGRRQPYIHILARHKKTFLLLGGKGQAEEFTGRLGEYGLTGLHIWIGSSLSYGDESIIYRTGADIQPGDISGLAVLYIENPLPLPGGGIPCRDDAFIRGNVPMTKEEIRAVSIAKLGLSENSVLYDVGAGTGSIAITAAALHERARVYAIERKAEAVDLIRQNKRKFCTDQVEIIEGAAPEAMEDLEPPTHVFIGGSSGNLNGILRCIGAKSPGARVVLNAITLETLNAVLLAEEEGLLTDVEIIQAGVARSKKMEGYHMMTGQNPVYIVSASVA